MKIKDMKDGILSTSFRSAYGRVVRYKLAVLVEKVVDSGRPCRTSDDVMKSELIKDVFKEARDGLAEILKDEDLLSCIADSRRSADGQRALQKIRDLRNSLS